MWSRSGFRPRTGAALLALSLLATGLARAATFSVDPISVSLATGNSSASVAVINQSAQKLRLQVTAFAWSQSPSGQMVLTPSDDLVFFPKLIELDPGETKRIRVGVTAAQGSTEKTYRIFMEELPSLQSITAPGAAGVQLTIRMKVGVPIFLAQIGPAHVAGEIRSATIHAGVLDFGVANTGNVHFSVSDVRISAQNAAGQTLFGQNATGWYVLPGEVRQYAVALPKDKCAAISSVSVTVRTDGGTFKNSFPSIQKDCAAAPRR